MLEGTGEWWEVVASLQDDGELVGGLRMRKVVCGVTGGWWTRGV